MRLPLSLPPTYEKEENNQVYTVLDCSSTRDLRTSSSGMSSTWYCEHQMRYSRLSNPVAQLVGRPPTAVSFILQDCCQSMFLFLSSFFLSPLTCIYQLSDSVLYNMTVHASAMLAWTYTTATLGSKSWHNKSDYHKKLPPQITAKRYMYMYVCTSRTGTVSTHTQFIHVAHNLWFLHVWHVRTRNFQETPI